MSEVTYIMYRFARSLIKLAKDSDHVNEIDLKNLMRNVESIEKIYPQIIGIYETDTAIITGISNE